MINIAAFLLSLTDSGFILGPTATVAVWDLAHEGYMAWDIGHMAKDYDAYCLNYGKGDEEQDKFFEPD